VAGRNSLRQPYFFNLDLRLLKAFRLGETRRLDLSVEAFNVTRNGTRISPTMQSASMERRWQMARLQ
jgi:hypothetical protein